MSPRLYPKPPDDVGTYPSAFLGIRAWRVSRTGEPLRAAFFDSSAWVPGVTRAECEHCPRVPNPIWDDSGPAAHRCGLHAYHSIGHLLAEQKADISQLVTGDQVIGIVAGRGNLEVHGAGWRSEEAQVLGLLAPPRPHLYVCPYCEGERELQGRCRGCHGTGVMAGASEEEGLVRAEFDHEAARERIENVAAHHGVGVFDTVEQMMAFGTTLAAPAPEMLRVPRTPLWASRRFENMQLLDWLFGFVTLVIAMSLLVVGSIETVFEGGRNGMVIVGPTLLFGELAALAGLLGLGMWIFEAALKRRAGRIWSRFASSRD